MNRLYVACEYDVAHGRVIMGSLHEGKMVLSEVRRFANQPIHDGKSLQWNIPQLYEETIAGLRTVGGYEEQVFGVSCHGWGADYLLFGSDGGLITPTFHHGDSRHAEGMQKVFSKVPWETVFNETGVHRSPINTLFQLGAEKSRRLKSAGHLLPIADGFNYLLAGVPRVERSSASTTQLYNPKTHAWSPTLLEALDLPARLFPEIVPGGTKLGPMRPEIAKETGLEDAKIVSSCSHEMAATIASLPINTAEAYAYLRLGSFAVMGTETIAPVINEVSRDMNFANETGYDGSVRLYKHIIGLWILDQCRRFWQETERDMDDEMLNHLAISAPPFESLINPTDSRFNSPDDMPAKIQAFCRETDQTVPRKPGPLARCVMESVALYYRKTLRELEFLSGNRIQRLFLLGGTGNVLMNHFVANALQVPVVVTNQDAAAMGNVLVQAITLGHIGSLAEAREIARNSVKLETIIPHATAWDAAYERLNKYCAPPETPAKA